MALRKELPAIASGPYVNWAKTDCWRPVHPPPDYQGSISHTSNAF